LVWVTAVVVEHQPKILSGRRVMANCLHSCGVDGSEASDTRQLFCRVLTWWQSHDVCGGDCGRVQV